MGLSGCCQQCLWLADQCCIGCHCCERWVECEISEVAVEAYRQSVAIGTWHYVNQDRRQAAWVHASAEKLSQAHLVDHMLLQCGELASSKGFGDTESGAGELTWVQEQSVSGACVPCPFAHAVHQLAAAAA